MEPHKPRNLLWDIESTSLNATFGTILCIGYKWEGEKAPTVISILDGKKKKSSMLDDKQVVRKFAEVFESADYHSTWYGERFDLPMLRSRMIKHELAPLPPKPHLDLWKTARYKFKLHSNRLMAWEQFLGLTEHKTAIDFDAWLNAAQGNKAAVAEVLDHCTKDVQVLEGVYNRLRPWMDVVPAYGLFSGEEGVCPSCGSAATVRRGYKVAMTRMYAQFRCRDCGHWFRGCKALVTTQTRHGGM